MNQSKTDIDPNAGTRLIFQLATQYVSAGPGTERVPRTRHPRHDRISSLEGCSDFCFNCGRECPIAIQVAINAAIHRCIATRIDQVSHSRTVPDTLASWLLFNQFCLEICQFSGTQSSGKRRGDCQGGRVERWRVLGDSARVVIRVLQCCVVLSSLLCTLY